MQYTNYKNIDDTNAEPLIESAAEIHVGPGTALEGVTLAHRIVVDGGVIPFPRAGLWIANEILMQPDTVVRGENISIVAKLVRNGRIDASGSSGASPGAAGTAGGRIFIAAKTLEGVALLARGGDGAAGKPGDRGADGRSGKCKGFGGYRMAQVGNTGAPGGNGGDGGAAGLIMARVVDLGTLSANAEGGKGGAPGQGGQGGRGGAGCTGLGGSQPTKANGLPGDSGQPGKDGAAVSTDSHAIDYKVLLDVTRKHLGQPRAIVDDLKEL